MITYSFIIPHHNTPDLLQRLIDTIPQRDDIEIIVVDDNSDEDKKANISRPDVKTIFIDKEQTKGAGKARNIGMEAASGKWLLFADADDMYKTGFLGVLDKYKNDDIEVLYFNIESFDSDTLAPLLNSKNDRAIKSRLLFDNYDGSAHRTKELVYLNWEPWNKMVSSFFIKRYRIYFEEVARGNDVFFSIQVGYFAKKIKIENVILYMLSYCKSSITYSAYTLPKTIATIKNIYHRNYFFDFVNYKEWTKIRKHESIIKFILSILYKHHNIKLFIRVIVYFAINFISLWKNKSMYVDVIQNNQKNILVEYSR